MIAKEQRDELERYKEIVQRSRRYNEDNVRRYWEDTLFTFKTSLTPDIERMLIAIGKPPIEFNTQEAYLSRLLGEYSKQQPSIEVMAANDKDVHPEMIEFVEGAFRHALYDANKNSFQYAIYKEQLAGGFSACKIWTEYAPGLSYEQIIKFDKVYDPTMTGFDPLARCSHKGDGRYCFEIFPMSEKEFRVMYPNYKVEQFSFSRSLGGYDFSYEGQKENIVLVCQFYEKKAKPTRIAQLADGRVMPVKEYDKLVTMWKELELIEQPPKIIGEPRWANLERVVRTRFVENDVLEYVETDFRHLPIIFADGNSALIKENEKDSVYQMTKPYLYHAKGAQKLKNFAGQTLAGAMENLLNKKLFIAEESLPTNEDFLRSIIEPQSLGHIITKAFSDNNPSLPLPPPREVTQVPLPPEVSGAFQMVDGLMQMILGSYDASLGINNNQLSGVAIVEAATQSNAAAMPYLVANMQMLNQLAEVWIDLAPKYMTTPRTVPVVGRDDKRSYKQVNGEGQMKLKYGENALQVKVEAGVSFAVQKSKALTQIIGLMQVSPTFGEFMSSEEGLPILLDNIECRGADILKMGAEKWLQKRAQQQQQMMQMQQKAEQNNPAILAAQAKQKEIEMKTQVEQMGLQLKTIQMQHEQVMETAKLAIDQQRADTERLEVMIEAGDAEANRAIQKEKHDTENFHSATELAIKAAAQEHTHSKELVELEHKILGSTNNEQ